MLEVFILMRRLAGSQETKKSVNSSLLGWQHMVSGVAQRSVLGPQLLTSDVNDIAEGTHSVVPKFADDICVGRKVNCEEEIKTFQKDIGRANA